MRRRTWILSALLIACVTAPDVTYGSAGASKPVASRADAIEHAFSRATAPADVRAANLYRDVLLRKTAAAPAYDALLADPDASWRAASSALDDLSGTAHAMDRVAILGSALRQPGTRSRAIKRVRAEITALTGAAATTESVDAARLLFIVAAEHGGFTKADRAKIDRSLAAARKRTDAADEAAAPTRLRHAEALAIAARTRLQKSAPKTKLGGAIVEAAALLELGDSLGERTTTQLLAPLRKRPKDTLADVDAMLADLPLSAQRERRLLVALVSLVGSGAAVESVLEQELGRLSAREDGVRAELLDIASALGRNGTARDRFEKLTDRYVGKAYGHAVRKSFERVFEATQGLPEGTTQQFEAGCDAEGCRWSVPIYDQNDPAIGASWFPNGPDKSMLCSAASSAMALAAALSRNPPDTRSVFVTNFQASAPPQRIAMLADALDTDPIEGGSVVDLEPLIESGIAYGGVAPNVLVENDNSDLSPSFIQGELTRSPGVIVHYGKYTKKAQVIEGPGFTVRYVTYERHGGHYVVVRGNSHDDFFINNPSHAQLDVDSLGTLHAASSTGDDGTKYVTILPNEDSVSYHWEDLQHDDEYRILNRVLSIRNLAL